MRAWLQEVQWLMTAIKQRSMGGVPLYVSVPMSFRTLDAKGLLLMGLVCPENGKSWSGTLSNGENYEADR